MEPWQSWTIVGVAGAGMYWYYTKQQTNKRRAGRTALSVEQAQSSRRGIDSKTKRSKDKPTGSTDQTTSDAPEAVSASLPSSGTDQVPKRKGVKKESGGATKISTADTVNENTRSEELDNEDVEEIDNKEFARQLSGAKTGTSLATPAKSSQPKKTQKLGKANGIPRADMSSAPADKAMSATSSTTGIDADDDLSPSDSPLIQAQSASDHGGVTDMLEAPTRGPSVLRVTESAEPQRSNQPKASKSAQAQETKKQRQRKQKNEAQKLERQQAELERRVLLEKQLRTAREAEGRPAKNGVPVSKPPANNAWSTASRDSGATNPASTNPASNAELDSNGPLLDTFEDNTQPEAPKSSGHRTGGASTVKNGAWDRDLPTEEEQLRLLTEQDGDGGWQTVEKPKKREKPANTVIDDGIAPRGKVLPKAEKNDNNPAKEEGYKSLYIPYAETGHPDDSDWPVA